VITGITPTPRAKVIGSGAVPGTLHIVFLCTIPQVLETTPFSEYSGVDSYLRVNVIPQF
jgi:hypothetical protein